MVLKKRGIVVDTLCALYVKLEVKAWGRIHVDSFRKNFLTNVLLLKKIWYSRQFRSCYEVDIFVDICVLRKIFYEFS